jgi:hypothetical protein
LIFVRSTVTWRGAIRADNRGSARPRFACRHRLVRRRAFRARLHAGAARVADVVALTFFVRCGISRLARFNVTAADLTNADREGSLFRRTPSDEHRPCDSPSLASITSDGLDRGFGGHWVVAGRGFHPFDSLPDQRQPDDQHAQSAKALVLYGRAERHRLQVITLPAQELPDRHGQCSLGRIGGPHGHRRSRVRVDG